METFNLDPGAEKSSYINHRALTAAQIRVAVTHNNRTNLEELQRDRHINENLSHLNQYLIGAKSDDVVRLAVEKITGRTFDKESWQQFYAKELWQDGKLNLTAYTGNEVNKNAKLLVEDEMKYPGAVELQPIKTATGTQYGFVPTDKAEFERWKERSLEFIKQKYGSDNVLSAVVHMDEGVPHMHCMIVPTYMKEDELHLGASHFVNGTKKPGQVYDGLTQLRMDYADYTGYDRPSVYSSVKQISRNAMYEAMYKAGSKTLVPPKEGQTAEEYYEEMADIFSALNVRTAWAEQKASQLINVRKDNAKKDQIIESKTYEIMDLKNQIDMLLQLRKKHEKKKLAQEIGQTLYPDPGELIRALEIIAKCEQMGEEYLKTTSQMKTDIQELEEELNYTDREMEYQVKQGTGGIGISE